MNEAQCRGIVRERSGGMCEVRVTAPGVCRGQGESMHHRRKVSQGGKWVPANIVHACGDGTVGCHGFLEANPAAARRRGLWLFAGQTPVSTPAQIVFRGMPGTYLLDDEGSITWLGTLALDRLSR